MTLCLLHYEMLTTIFTLFDYKEAHDKLLRRGDSSYISRTLNMRVANSPKTPVVI
jgi:hypothetical protein